MTTRKILAQFTTDQLLEEIVRRRDDRKDVGDVQPCDECRHFRFWTEGGDPPADYNPCQMGKRMRFHMPGDDESPDGGIGFYRRVCVSRNPREATN